MKNVFEKKFRIINKHRVLARRRRGAEKYSLLVTRLSVLCGTLRTPRLCVRDELYRRTTILFL